MKYVILYLILDRRKKKLRNRKEGDILIEETVLVLDAYKLSFVKDLTIYSICGYGERDKEIERVCVSVHMFLCIGKLMSHFFFLSFFLCTFLTCPNTPKNS